MSFRRPTWSVLAISALLVVLAVPAAADAGVRPGKYVAKNKSFAKSLRKGRMVSLWLTRKRVNDVDFRVFQTGCNLGPNSLYGRAGGQMFVPHKEWNRHGTLRKGRVHYSEHLPFEHDALGNPIEGSWNQVVTGRVEGNRIIGTLRWNVTRNFLYGKGLKKKRKFHCKGSWDFKARWRSRETDGPSKRPSPGPREDVPEEGQWHAFGDVDPNSDADPEYNLDIELLDDRKWHVSATAGTPCGVAEANWTIPANGNAIEGGSAPAHTLSWATVVDYAVSGSVSLSAHRVPSTGAIVGTLVWHVTITGDPPHCPQAIEYTWSNFEARYPWEGD